MVSLQSLGGTQKHELHWIEKYRPSSLEEVIDHSEKIETLRALNKKNEMPHLLFYGAPGSGKTSMILACARDIYGENYKKYILELNASDDRGIETVRKKIPDFVKTSSSKIRLVILDEADAMTNDAQSALRRVIEKYSKTSRFCLICNNINKIIPGLQSRCTKMRFGYLNADQIHQKLKQIITIEGVYITDEALDRLISINRDFRQILNTLQCLHAIRSADRTSPEQEYKAIQPDEVNQYLGIPTQTQVDQLVATMTESKHFSDASRQSVELFRNNQWNIADIVNRISNHVLNVMKIDDKKKYALIDKLADIEVRISQSNDAEVQMYALVAAFRHVFCA